MRLECTTLGVAFFPYSSFLVLLQSIRTPLLTHQTHWQFSFLMSKIDEATITSTRSFVHRDVYFVAVLGRIIATTTATKRYQKSS